MPNTFKNYHAKNAGTSATTVFTGPAATQSTVIGMTVANVSNNNINVDVFLTVGGVDYYLVKGAMVPVGGALVPIGGDQKVVVEAGDLVRVQSSAASSADVNISVLEIS